MADKTFRKTVKFPQKTVNHYINILKKDIQLKGVFLFGSFANGQPTKHSDVDLVVISPDFKKMDFGRRMDFLQLKRDKISLQAAMDIFGYTPHEFRWIDRQSAIMARAKKEGKWLYKK